MACSDTGRLRTGVRSARASNTKSSEQTAKRLDSMETECCQLGQELKAGRIQTQKLSSRLDCLEATGCEHRLAALEQQSRQLRQELTQTGRIADQLANQLICNTLAHKSLAEESIHLRDRLTEVEQVNRQLAAAVAALVQLRAIAATTVSASAPGRDMHPRQQQQHRQRRRRKAHSTACSFPCCCCACSVGGGDIAALDDEIVAAGGVVGDTGDSASACCGCTQCPPALCGPASGPYYTLDFTAAATAAVEGQAENRAREDDGYASMAPQAAAVAAAAAAARLRNTTLVGDSADLETRAAARDRRRRRREWLLRPPESARSDSELATGRFCVASSASGSATSADNADISGTSGPTREPTPSPSPSSPSPPPPDGDDLYIDDDFEVQRVLAGSGDDES